MAYVWAHRGASAYAPENTLEAFRLAAELHADGIELDVHLSKDGEVVVAHDETVKRTTCGVTDKRLVDMTVEEMQKIDVWNGKEGYHGAHIPTLRQVLEFLQTNNLFLNIELKTTDIFYPDIEKKTVALVHEYGLADRVIYSSFNHYSLMLAREADPDCKIAPLYSEGMFEPHTYALHLKANAIHPHFRTLLIPGTAEGCHANGIKINPWTVDDEETMRWLLSIGCNALITNRPDVGRKVVDAL